MGKGMEYNGIETEVFVKMTAECIQANEGSSGKYKLPISVSSFPVMIKQNYIYVDKTEYVYNLIETGRIYFLSRPRRFGKTLLVSILEEIFKGNKHLFKDYWIYERIQWKQYPVIHLDFLGIDYEDLGVEDALITWLDEFAAQYDIQLTGKSCKSRFGDLIKKLSAKENEQVVILIDEYDKPIIDFIENENMKTAEENRKKLKIFYSVLKHHDRNIKFLFVTGVSRFTRVSIFSDLNNLDDITFHRGYAKILGYTHDEIEKYYGHYIDKWSREEGKTKEELLERLKEEYNGYSWDGKNFVYNPDSIHKALNEFSFGSYWFATGTPTFLVKKLMEQGIDIVDFENLRVKREFFNEYDTMDINLLMFQAGYLTIKESNETGFKLYYPNKEVQSSFLHLLLKKYSQKNQLRIEEITPKIKTALSEGNINSFIDMTRPLLADIPYNLSLSKYEAFYHSIIFVALKLSNLAVTVEKETNLGRIDMLVQTERYVYIIEFKMDNAGDALKQILAKKYYEPYLAGEKEIILLGIGFSREDRNISQVKYASIPPLPPGAIKSLPLSFDQINVSTLDYPAGDREFARE
jgi:hypothetical protein